MRSLLTNVVFLIASTIVALGSTELALRVMPNLLPGETRLRLRWETQRVSYAAHTRADPAIGFLYAPNEHAEVRQGEVHFTYTTDRDGFRNTEPRPDTAVVVAIGDSRTFAFGVADSEAWPRLVANGLPTARLCNLGLSGTGPLQYGRIYERFGVPLRPKLLLLGLFPGSDIDDDRFFDRWRNAGSPGNYLVWRMSGSATPHRARSWLKRSYLVVAAREAWKYRHARFAGRTIRLADGSRLLLVPTPLALTAKAIQPGHPDLVRTLGALQQIRDLASQYGTHLLVLVFPSKEEVYLPLHGAAAPALVGPMLPALRRLGITYLDLTPAFRERAAAGVSLYFEVDGHANRAGNRVIADAVLRHLRTHAAEYGIATPAAATPTALSQAQQAPPASPPCSAPR